jgi:hypothetical protein
VNNDDSNVGDDDDDGGLDREECRIRISHTGK